ncbi:F-box/LRR-repeat protein 16 [Cichlidogyrus casuarinus]|uniref:F-box/LRR-repeat protein 16 n=1 Tax=Cichlidogyrus casuarinus TaxID=1844966 RepID=A0ABD2QH71_9PLAT
MNSLKNLTLRWCDCITDASLIHVLNISTLQFLSISGCRKLTGDGISNLVRHRNLKMLELTHCPNATVKVKAYLKQNLVNCILLD